MPSPMKDLFLRAGGMARVVQYTFGTISAGASGDILIISAPPSGQVGRLRFLTTTSGVQRNLTLTVDGYELVSGSELRNAPPNGPGAFAIGDFITGTGNLVTGSGVLTDIWFSEGVTLTLDSGSTTTGVQYSVEYRESFL